MGFVYRERTIFADWYFLDCQKYDLPTTTTNCLEHITNKIEDNSRILLLCGYNIPTAIYVTKNKPWFSHTWQNGKWMLDRGSGRMVCIGETKMWKKERGI